jgi:SAM-dependent methyltransferase
MHRTKFEGYFVDTYSMLEQVLREEFRDDMSILDLGSGNCTVASLIDRHHKDCFIYCLDNDPNAFKDIPEMTNNTGISTYPEDANKFMDCLTPEFDAISIHAALHHMSDPMDHEGYVRRLLTKCNSGLREEGLLLIGDYYFPVHVSDEEVEMIRQRQLAKIGHADPREMFVDPTIILKAAEKWEVKRYFNFRIEPDVDKRYYLMILKVPGGMKE